jgi:ABC-type lipoprotein export system ATPase subunit
MLMLAWLPLIVVDVHGLHHGRSETTDLTPSSPRSGSGKTTLLNVLAHRTELLSGTVAQRVFVNGAPTTLADIRRLSSYVEQEDALIGALTVRETLHFAAQLSLPR